MNGNSAAVAAPAAADNRPPPNPAFPSIQPGEAFTRTSKLLVLVLVAGHALLRFVPSSLDYLTIIPAKTVPFVWTVFTAGYVEQVLPGAIGSSLGLLFCGKDLEPVWGRSEFLNFVFLMNSVAGICAFLLALAAYHITGNQSFLYTPLSGFHGCLAAFLVALKQVLPNLELPMCFFWKIKAKWMPFFVMSFSIVMAFVVPDSINFLPTLLAGTYAGWIYLRFFQQNPMTGLRGDPADDFSFVSFFPQFMRPALEPPANFFDRLLCARRRVSQATARSLPLSDQTKAARWRDGGDGDDATELESLVDDDRAAKGGGADA